MLNNESRKLGTINSCKLSRERAIEQYYKNPNICKNCNEIIVITEKGKVSEIRKKVFCTRNCAATYNNTERNKTRVYKPRKKYKGKINPKFNFLENKTKKEIFDNHKNWQSARTSIRRHAAKIFKDSDKPKVCECGYNKHYEICHIKSVSSFSEDSTIEEINNINNLVALCPNCHWEFDNILRVREEAISSSS